jgi:hypothetical protein
MEQHKLNPSARYQASAFMVRGLDVAEIYPRSGAGRKMFLDIPFYRTGVYTHDPFVSVMAIFRQ